MNQFDSLKLARREKKRRIGQPRRLEEMESPKDLKGLTYPQLKDLATEIREKLIQTISRQGGHLASNLGVVELTLALHRVFDAPTDKLVFDVGHQSYVHKLLTGRYDRFDSLRTFGGMSGFPKREESEYDTFDTGHASTALSAALGMARARDLKGEHHHVIAVVGDGAMTGGMCFEALNDAGNTRTRLILILNDNEMSISPNVGALAEHLTQLRLSKGWTGTKRVVKRGLQRLPVIGSPVYRVLNRTKDWVKSLFVDEGFFASLGFHYYGPINGHDLKSLEKTLNRAKQDDAPVVIHVLTRKGYGYEQAEKKPEAFHGTPPFYIDTGKSRKQNASISFSETAGRTLVELAARDARIVAITAAMVSGTGLSTFQKTYPKRLMDVGITEEHAMTLAAGLAVGGMKPYFAVYATFLQRSYDQLIEDVCMQKLPVTLLVDRAGLVGQDGATHQGLFTLPQLLPIPNLTVLCPRDVAELPLMIRWSAACETPVAICYGRDSVDLSDRYPVTDFTPGHWDELEPGDDAVIYAVGSMVAEALETRRLLLEKGLTVSVVSCSSVSPLDEHMLQAKRELPAFTMEEGMLTGGFGSLLCARAITEDAAPPRICFGIDGIFVQHGRRDQLLKYLGLSADQMAARIRAALPERMRHEG